jgi:hypothetical protein
VAVDALDELEVLVEAAILGWRGRRIPRWVRVGADISAAEGAAAVLGRMVVARGRP